MKRIFPYLLTLCLFFAATAHCSELLKVWRTDTKDIVHLYFSFDSTPEFTSSVYDRRIDLEFINTSSSPSVDLGAPDQAIVKILPRPTKDRYILSLFFRYRPQSHKLTRSSDGRVVFEVLLGNEYSKSYRKLADRLKGLSLSATSGPSTTNPTMLSPYARNWLSFFSEYESAVAIAAPVRLSSPPFPMIDLLPEGSGEKQQVLSPEMLALAGSGEWHNLAQKILTTLNTATEVGVRKLLALSYGEALVRSGDFDGAYRQLYLLAEQYAEEHLGIYAKYLLVHLRALFESPFIADAEFRLLEPSIPDAHPLAPYFLLSRIDAALAIGDFPRLNRLLLQDGVALPDQIAKMLQVRQGDYWAGIGQTVKAYAAYQLVLEAPEFQNQPRSMATWCNLSYEQKLFAEAEACYGKLFPLIDDRQMRALVDYRRNMARLRAGDHQTPAEQFARIEKEYPKTEAGFRATLKKSDLLFLKDQDQGPEIIAAYRTIAREASDRSIREEALFKQALVHNLLAQDAEAVEVLQTLLREFLTGDVRISAQALLIELLPGEIKRLVDRQQYLEPLVLAKQNRLFFQNGWIDSTLLVDIAEAYNRIGIFDEAQKLYLYLIGIKPVDQREQYFLPMIEATYAYGNYPLVEEYAAQYTYTYPTGRYGDEILLLRLQALVADERLSEALSLLPSPLPDDVSANSTMYRLALALYFRQDTFDRSADVGRRLEKAGQYLEPNEQFMFAESLYRTGSMDEAERVFLAIPGECAFNAQSLYRLAELSRRRGEEKKALSFFEKIVETEQNSLWKQYAERELQFAKKTTVNQR